MAFTHAHAARWLLWTWYSAKNHRKEVAENILLTMDLFGYSFDITWYDYVSEEIRNENDRERVRHDVSVLDRKRRKGIMSFDLNSYTFK